MNKKTLTVAALVAMSIPGTVLTSSAAEPNQDIPVEICGQNAGLFAHLQSILAEFCECSESAITMESRLRDDLGIDSLGMIQLNSLIYFEFNVEIPLSDFSSAQTVADIYDLILLADPEAE